MSMDPLLRDLDGASPYELLGLVPTASDAEIKEARRRLQRQAHPDLVTGDESAARVINIAADLLLDRERRLAFDRGAGLAEDPAVVESLYEGKPGTGKMQMPPPDSSAWAGWVQEPTPWDLLPPRPGTIKTAMWLMYGAAMACVLFLIAGVFGSAVGSGADVAEGLAIVAIPMAVWLGITMAMGTAIRNGWRGAIGGGWALTVIFLVPIGTGCGTLMNYALTPAIASDRSLDAIARAPELIERSMIWALPLGLVLAVAAMVLTLLPASRHYLETMAAVRSTAEQRSRRHRRASRWLSR